MNKMIIYKNGNSTGAIKTTYFHQVLKNGDA